MKSVFSCVRIFIFLCLTCFVLTGCFEEKSPAKGETHTVEWFKNHKEEREVVLRECSNNPGELRHLPNCQNAAKADYELGTELKPLQW